jgi:hypothetical protein
MRVRTAAIKHTLRNKRGLSSLTMEEMVRGA